MSGNLNGFVFQADGTPVSNASVLLRKTDSRAENVTYTAQTDENGKVALKQLVPGTYQAIVTSGKLTAVKSDIVITENKETALPVLMAKEQIAVPNGDFEASWSNKRNISSWSTESTGAFLENKTPYAGKTRISFWSSSSFLGHIYQTISGLENGTYYVTAMVKGISADGDESYIYAKDSEGNFIGKQEIPISENDWIKVGVPVQVTDGTMTIGVYQKLSGSMWLNLDNVEAYYAGPVDTAIKDVESKIEAIGTEIALGSEDGIKEARAAYDALTEAQKEQVSNYETLEKAEEKLAELKADAAAVKDVESKIEAIGTDITLESEDVIKEARAVYDALTEAQKEQVSNYETLEKAEEKLAELKKAPVHADGLSDSCDADGNWYYYSDNAVDTAYTGLAANQNGWFMVVNGKVDFGYTGLAANQNGWFMVVNGKVDFGYTGLAANENGWFMVVNGKIDFEYNGVVFNEFGGWYVQSGKINFAYTGMIQYQGVWCQVLNGKVMF
ncbi:MAG: hypothetical protein BHW44_09060 [Roseburia sp. 40_7]|nr:MAG: hypothetical protein BHW44_09060 [Roseburia sp. 40_7]